MEQRTSFLRLLGWMMLFVTIEIIFLLVLSFEKYWELYLFWIIESILIILLFFVGRLASKRIRNEYSDSPMTLYFFNLIFFSAIFVLGPYMLDKAEEKLFDFGCGCNFPGIMKVLFDLGQIVKEWGIFSVISIYLFSFLNFLMLTHDGLISKQRIIQVIVLLMMIAICIFCWYVTSYLFFSHYFGSCGK